MPSLIRSRAQFGGRFVVGEHANVFILDGRLDRRRSLLVVACSRQSAAKRPTAWLAGRLARLSRRHDNDINAPPAKTRGRRLRGARGLVGAGNNWHYAHNWRLAGRSRERAAKCLLAARPSLLADDHRPTASGRQSATESRKLKARGFELARASNSSLGGFRALSAAQSVAVLLAPTF